LLSLLALALLPGQQSWALSKQAQAAGLPTLAPMLEQVTPSVVNIRVTKAMPTQNLDRFGGGRLPDEIRRFFENNPNLMPRDQRQPFATGAGSGVIVDADRGYIVTNHHVIDNAREISVQLSDRRIVEAELVGSDPRTDLALLQIEAEGLTDIEYADIDSLAIGDYVVAIGNPFGLGQTVTSGIVSALGRAGLNANNYEDYIQTDAAINVGNSGGALVDLEGRLVGINTAIISGGGGGSAGVGFAVPVDMVASITELIERDGEVRRGLLGVTIADVTPAVREALALEVPRGAVVTSVMEGSAAADAGIQLSDVIIALDEEPITSGRDLRNSVGVLPSGKQVTLALIRDGQRMDVDAIIGGADGEAITSARGGDGSPSDQFRGAELADAVASGNQPAGVVVTGLNPQSPAAGAGLRQGDRIIAVDRQPVTNLREFNAALGESERFTAITVYREGQQLLIFVP
jgi:Do/DeqQ family serine protease